MPETDPCERCDGSGVITKETAHTITTMPCPRCGERPFICTGTDAKPHRRVDFYGRAPADCPCCELLDRISIMGERLRQYRGAERSDTQRVNDLVTQKDVVAEKEVAPSAPAEGVKA